MSVVSAFVFPGQGSQAVGMLTDMAESYSSIKETFKEASEALGYDLWQLVQNGPKELLDQTDKTQPAILTTSVALWRVWQEQTSIEPSYVAGHSLGEYSALVAAGSLMLSDAVKLVELRGQLMQKAVPAGQGAMAAILGLTDEEVIAICQEESHGQVVSAVNFNAPGQVVIAGNTDAVNRAIEACKARGAKRALPLPVSVPSHCALMKPAAEEFANALMMASWKNPSIAIVQNVTADVSRDLQTLKESLLAQLYSPVRWVETIEMLSKLGVTTLVECGPGKVLTGLNKRCVKDLAHYTLETPEAFTSTLTALQS